MIESCKRHGVDPFEYLRDVVGSISGVPPKRIKEMMPVNWLAAMSERAKAA